MRNCQVTGIMSVGCIALTYELIGTTVMLAFSSLALTTVNPFVDNVIEPIMHVVFYLIYVVFIALPSGFE